MFDPEGAERGEGGGMRWIGQDTHQMSNVKMFVSYGTLFLALHVLQPSKSAWQLSRIHFHAFDRWSGQQICLEFAHVGGGKNHFSKNDGQGFGKWNGIYAHRQNLDDCQQKPLIGGA